jgi:hypothetical protein
MGISLEFLSVTLSVLLVVEIFPIKLPIDTSRGVKSRRQGFLEVLLMIKLWNE